MISRHLQELSNLVNVNLILIDPVRHQLDDGRWPIPVGATIEERRRPDLLTAGVAHWLRIQLLVDALQVLARLRDLQKVHHGVADVRDGITLRLLR